MPGENPTYGYDRIVGALWHLDDTFCEKTVGNVLRVTCFCSEGPKRSQSDSNQPRD